MAQEARRTYPLMAVKHWWTLREKFKQAIPTKTDTQYLSTVLGMKPESARTNVIPTLRQVGLIDKDEKTISDLAKKWRDDKEYVHACREIIASVYPQSLSEACPNPHENQEEVKRWFASETGAGKSAIQKMTLFYLILAEADPSKGKDVVKSTVDKKDATPRIGKQKQPAVMPKAKGGEKELVRTPGMGKWRFDSSLNVNIQVHISAESTAEQIDQIFASMSKHFRICSDDNE